MLNVKQKLPQSSVSLITTVLVATLLTTACGSNEHEEVYAVDKVEEAGEIARANAPEAEVLDLEVTEVPAAETTDDTDMVATDDTDMVATGDTDDGTLDNAVQSDDIESSEELDSEDVIADEDSEASEANSMQETTTVALDAKVGKKRYETTCKVCHDTGLLQSPKIGDEAAWAPRIAKGMDTLRKHSAEGYNQMPAQATGDVSKEEVYAAVDYLVAESS